MKKAFLRLAVSLLITALFAAGTAPGRALADEREEGEALRSAYAVRSGTGAGEAADFAVREDPEAGSTSCTLMIYVIGSNLESKAGKASKDIGEMLGSGVDFSRVNIPPGRPPTGWSPRTTETPTWGGRRPSPPL